MRNVINPASLNDGAIIAYLNTNKTIESTSVSAPGSAYFSGSFLAAPTGLPATSVTNFTFFVNGQFVEPSAIASFVDNGGGVCTLTINSAQLGFTLATQDEIAAIGKFA